MTETKIDKKSISELAKAIASDLIKQQKQDSETSAELEVKQAYAGFLQNLAQNNIIPHIKTEELDIFLLVYPELLTHIRKINKDIDTLNNSIFDNISYNEFTQHYVPSNSTRFFR